jgi:lipopolysaccharide export system permease protein
MKKLDWYIIRQFLGAFFYTIMLFSAIAVVIDISERIDDFLENSAPLYLILFHILFFY